ncbi:hypothetical protein B566_EDAN004507 [Ephemera danica]|nr:hypothetical protein B566_EDAN004507 [Ephemera danica]
MFHTLVVTLAVLATVMCDEPLEKTMRIERVEGDHIPQIFGDIFIQLAETAYSLPELRNRRHAHGNKKIKMPGDKFCCDFPNLSSKRDVRACHQEFLTTSNISHASTVEENQHASKCFMECIAKRKGWVNGDGALDLTVVNATLQAGELSAQWQQLQAEAAEKCFPEIIEGEKCRAALSLVNAMSERRIKSEV